MQFAGHGDHVQAEAFEYGQQGEDLWRVAGVGNCEHQVAAGDHAQIAVTRFAGMYKKCRSASAGKGGGDLMADMPGFAHAGHHYPALAVEDQLTGEHKGWTYTCI